MHHFVVAVINAVSTIVICVSSSESVATCTAPVCVKKVAVHWEKKNFVV